MWLQGDADNTIIAGNLIGTTKNGNAVLPGMLQGIRVFEDLTTSGTRIGTNSDGTSDTLERNVIAGATSINVYLPALQTIVFLETISVLIQQVPQPWVALQ